MARPSHTFASYALELRDTMSSYRIEAGTHFRKAISEKRYGTALSLAMRISSLPYAREYVLYVIGRARVEYKWKEKIVRALLEKFCDSHQADPGTNIITLTWGDFFRASQPEDALVLLIDVYVDHLKKSVDCFSLYRATKNAMERVSRRKDLSDSFKKSFVARICIKVAPRGLNDFLNQLINGGAPLEYVKMYYEEEVARNEALGRPIFKWDQELGTSGLILVAALAPDEEIPARDLELYDFIIENTPDHLIAAVDRRFNAPAIGIVRNNLLKQKILLRHLTVDQTNLFAVIANDGMAVEDDENGQNAGTNELLQDNANSQNEGANEPHGLRRSRSAGSGMVGDEETNESRRKRPNTSTASNN